MRKALTLCLAITLSSPAIAGARFEAFEGPTTVKTGEGGSRLTKNGIDYWTNGSPARRYQLIGFITDKRDDNRLHGNAIGSPAIAKLTKEHGGDAVVMMESDEKFKGTVTNGNAYASGNNTFGNAFSTPVVDRVSRLIVIKYVEDAPNSAADSAPMRPQ